MKITPVTYAEILDGLHNHEFIVGIDSFEDLEIVNPNDPHGFRYFRKPSQPLNRYIKRFVLKEAVRTKKVCDVVLIEKGSGKFEPRFEFRVLDLAKTKLDQVDMPITEGENRLVKARVNLADCHNNLEILLGALAKMPNVDFEAERYALIPKDQKVLLDEAIGDTGKEGTLQTLAQKYEINEQDVAILTKRKEALDKFKKLLDDPNFFMARQDELEAASKGHRPEDVWQDFFEKNRWIFGYGLQLVACESLDGRKLETIVAGADVFTGPGKRIDSLLKTRGSINRSIFTEIKTHTADLLEDYERSGVYSPAKQLRGAVAQVQKTVHKVNLKVTQNFQKIFDKDDNPTGESIATVKPRAIVVVGKLDQFSTENGINEEQYSSFELYRQQTQGVEILTFDELYQRALYILEE